MNSRPMKSANQTYDLLICGAGVAGVAAALEAGRAGLRVGLVEKTILPGGLATSGLIYVYLPLCDGHGRQVQFGLAEELLHLSLKYGPGSVPDWRQGRDGKARYQARFSPASFVLALDEALEEAAVEPWYDTLACLPIMDGERIAGVEVETKHGRERLEAPCVLDATGDAELAHRAGAPCERGTNVMAIWALEVSLAAARRAVEEEDGSPLLRVFTGSWGRLPEDPEANEPWTGLDAQDVTRFVIEGRRVMRKHYAELHAQGGETAQQNLYPLMVPSQAQFRTTRRIVGQATMQTGDHTRVWEESVALVADWRQAGKVWEVPYDALVAQKVRGLLTAGRCMSSSGDAWHATRVIPAAVATGQAAGMAATLAVSQGCFPDEVQAEEIQRGLDAKGIPYRKSQVGLDAS